MNGFKKKLTFIANVILNYGLAKTRLDKYLKSGISQYRSKSNIVKALKHISNHTAALLSNLLITNQDTEFEKVTIS